MKKLLITICAVVLTSFAVYMIYSINNKALDSKNVNPVESFGNQRNSEENTGEVTAKKGNWLYGTDSGFKIMKADIDDMDNTKTIYTEKNKKYAPYYVSISDGWIYFVCGSEGGNEPLCRVKGDGSNKTTLLHDFSSDKYVLTKDVIYYQKEGPMGENSIYAMNLDGSNKRIVVWTAEYFDGIDNRWIYYRKKDNGPVYRVRPDGQGQEKVLDGTNIRNYTVDNGQIFYIYYKKDEFSIIKKSNGKETVLIKMSDPDQTCYCLNKDGDWLYYTDGDAGVDKVYKINVKKKGEKKLVYTCEKKDDNVECILLYDGDVYISTSSKALYTKKDGTIIDLESFGD